MEPDAFGQLLVAQLPGLLRYALSITSDEQQAQDLVSETMLRALEKADTFRGESGLATWLHRILHNLAVDQFRRNRELPTDAVAERIEKLWEQDSYTVDTACIVARAEDSDELLDALIRLPFIYRSAVVLHDGHGLTSRQVAEIQNVGLSASKARLRRGRMMLVTALAEGEERRAIVSGVPMDCWETRQLVSQYMDDELTSGARLQVEQHLDGCPTCPPLYASLVCAQGAVADLGSRDSDNVIQPEVLAKIKSLGGPRA